MKTPKKLGRHGGKKAKGKHKPRTNYYGQPSIDPDLDPANTQGIGDVRVKLVGDYGDNCDTYVQIRCMDLDTVVWSSQKPVTRTGCVFIDRMPGEYKARFTVTAPNYTKPDVIFFDVIVNCEVTIKVKYLTTPPP